MGGGTSGMLRVAEQYLPELWVILIVLFLLYYAVTDGYDLGVGIISLFTPLAEDRSAMIFSIKGIWSGNQTWIVVLGGMLFGAFPLFYSLLLTSLYIPMVLMLFAFVFRGIGIDLGEHYQYTPFWRYSFGLGSLAATLAQGFALGGLLGGLDLQGGRFVGGVWDWLNPFAGLITLGVLFGYIMLGGNFLVWKLEGRLEEKGRRFALAASIAAGLVSAATWVWVILRYPFFEKKLHLWPDQLFLILFPLLAVCSFAMFLRAILKRHNLGPLLWNAAIVLFSFLGLSVGFWPYMIPSRTEPLTFHAATSSSPTLLFMLVVMVILTPVILVYHNYQYWVFRGKTRGGGEGEPAMAEIAEKMRLEATEKGHIPVTPGITDLPSVENEGEVERMAQRVRENGLQVRATVQAVKEHIGVAHMRRAVTSAARKALARPETRRKGMVMLSGAALAAAAFKAISCLRSGSRRKES